MSEWRIIETHGGKYLASRCGDVKRADGRQVGQWLNNNGYKMVRLSSPRGLYTVHRLVARAFVPNPDSLPCVNHLDFNRANNEASNLEWCTQGQNIRHSDLAGRMNRNYWKGRRSPNAALSDETAQAIRRMYAAGGHSLEAVGKTFGASKRTVERIVKGESYVQPVG